MLEKSLEKGLFCSALPVSHFVVPSINKYFLLRVQAFSLETKNRVKYSEVCSESMMEELNVPYLEWHSWMAVLQCFALFCCLSICPKKI